MRPDHTIFCMGTESALDKLWTGTRTSSVALYKHYKLYKHNKQNKTRVCKCAPARSSSRNELVRKWAGEKEKRAGVTEILVVFLFAPKKPSDQFVNQPQWSESHIKPESSLLGGRYLLRKNRD